eukprot:scaffold121696_cov69-Phaeocystis_antarctica.AAC.1
MGRGARTVHARRTHSAGAPSSRLPDATTCPTSRATLLWLPARAVLKYAPWSTLRPPVGMP